MRSRMTFHTLALGALLALPGLARADYPWAAPPFLIKDVSPGASNSFPSTFDSSGNLGGDNLLPKYAQIGGIVFFAATDGVHGFELWRSDGTPAGTWMVKDINPGSASGLFSPPNYPGMAVIGGKLYLATANDGVSGNEPWVSDGTEAGTVMVKDINPGPSGSAPRFFVDLNGTAIFNANDGAIGQELWKSDGTAAGTVLVKDILPGPLPSFPAMFQNGVLGSKLVFGLAGFGDGINGNEVWVTDGTTAGTMLLKDINPGPAGSVNAVAGAKVGGMLYFPATTAAEGSELWATDGTTAGTVLVKDIRPGSAGSTPRAFANVGGTLYFRADDGASGAELWKSDGTTAGTALVADIRPGTGASSPRWITDLDGIAMFTADDGTNGREMWRSDGTAAGTSLVKDIFPGSSSGNANRPDAVVLDGEMVFQACDAAEGCELWTSDGTAAGTVMAPGNVPGTVSGAPDLMTYVASTRQVFLRFTTPDLGYELWSFYKNLAPDCSASVVTPSLLWPPNHKMNPVQVVGLTDPDGDLLELTITSVFSDEPTSGLFPGDPSPDAQLLGESATLRKERDDNGNGRVYTVSWTATDMPFGATCVGTATVCVPHDMGNPTCGDEGPLYDATQP